MKQKCKAVVYGVITIFVSILVVSFILSMLLRFTSLTEDALQAVILVTSFVAMFLGGLIAGRKSQQSGWLVGGLTGLFYTLLIFLIQFLGFKQSFVPMQYLYHAAYIIVCVIGAALGVNISGKKA